MILSRLPFSAAVLLAFGVAAPGLALAASADQLPDIRHTVQSGDTLEAVAKRYLKDPQQWRAVGTLNGVKDPLRLPIGSVIVIPANMVGYQEVTISHIKGVARVRSPLAGGDWQSAASGTTLTEGDELQVPAGSFVTLRFADGSSVRINENSELKLSELRKNSRTDEQQSVLDLSRGGLESHVTPVMDQRRKRKFEIKTPMATTSVRGTVFSVSVTDSGKAITAVDQGVVQVQGHPAQPTARQAAQQALVHAGSGVAVQTSGQVGATVALLEAPSLQGNPAVFEDANFLTLQVGEVPRAQQYGVLLALDPELSRVILRQNHASPTFKFEALPDGTYYMSARAIDDQDIPGKPATQTIKVKATPIPPLYSSPAPEGLIGLSDGELLCTEGGSGIAGYRIQVSASRDFSTPLQDSGVVGNCQASVASLGVGSYFWRAASVRKLADGSLDQGPFAQPQAFKTGSNPTTLGADALSAGEASAPNLLQLSWPAEAGQRFNLQLATDESFAAPLATAQLDQPQWTSDALGAGDYYVRIQVLDPSGLKSRYSDPRKLTVEPSIITGSGGVLKTGEGKAVLSPR